MLAGMSSLPAEDVDGSRADSFESKRDLDAWKSRFKHIQSLPQTASISHDDIAEEIAAYRRDESPMVLGREKTDESQSRRHRLDPVRGATARRRTFPARTPHDGGMAGAPGCHCLSGMATSWVNNTSR
jgi:hypothetical protein